MLGEVVDRVEAVGDEAGHRRGGDDAASARGCHRPAHGAEPEHDAVDVDAHDAAVVGVGQREQVEVRREDARVQMRDTDRPEVVDESRPGRAVGDVEVDVPAADLGRVHLAELVLDVGDDDVAPGRRELRRGSAPMPDAPPVTSASFPVRSIVLLSRGGRTPSRRRGPAARRRRSARATPSSR